MAVNNSRLDNACRVRENDSKVSLFQLSSSW
jgi:hypothetical protein